MNSDQRGSALVLALFVLVLLTAMGVSLLFVTEAEMKMSTVDLRAKKEYFTAEAALEDGRETLRVINKSSSTPANREILDDELQGVVGGNGTLDFDAGGLKGVFDSSGNPTGFAGYGDDLPLRVMTTFGDSRYVAFLTNDAVDGLSSLHDTNDRVVITGAAAGPKNSFELVQAIVERVSFPPLPATITILGPAADFDGGTSNAKSYTGNDCGGGGLSFPVVGVIGSVSETSARTGVHKPGTYTSTATGNGVLTVKDVDATIDGNWKNCDYLLSLARAVRAAADVVGNASTPSGSLGTPGSPRIVYIEGDYTVGGGFSGGGLLWVTGTLTFNGNASWSGVIFTVGKGVFARSGGGNGDISGANLVANVAGADGVLWTADDCDGADGVSGTADDGVSGGSYDNSGGGTGDTEYCQSAIQSTEQQFPYRIVSYRER